MHGSKFSAIMLYQVLICEIVILICNNDIQVL